VDNSHSYSASKAHNSPLENAATLWEAQHIAAIGSYMVQHVVALSVATDFTNGLIILVSPLGGGPMGAGPRAGLQVGQPQNLTLNLDRSAVPDQQHEVVADGEGAIIALRHQCERHENRR
jgi:hypothetical protein